MKSQQIQSKVVGFGHLGWTLRSASLCETPRQCFAGAAEDLARTPPARGKKKHNPSPPLLEPWHRTRSSPTKRRSWTSTWLKRMNRCSSFRGWRRCRQVCSRNPRNVFFFYFAFIDFGIFRSSATLSLLFFEEVLLAKACGVQGGSAAGVVVEMVPIFIGLG